MEINEHQSKKNPTYIFVCGYGWSGSSALVDLLCEIDGIKDFGQEFRLIKEHKGLIDLENAFLKQPDPLQIDLAIKDFLWLTKSYARVPRKIFSKDGAGYELFFENQFINKTNEFIEKITEFHYNHFWFYFSFYWSVGERFIERLRAKFFRKQPNYQCYFPKSLKENEFDKCVSDYLQQLFEITNISSDYIIMDQSVPANDVGYAYKYFENAKVIIIDRDPRDIYVEMVRQKALIGIDLAKNDDAEMYIKWHNRLREEKNSSENVLRLKFEDMVLNYDNTLNKIYEYLEIDKKKHVKKRNLFDPEVSKKNIGLWRKYHNQDVMNAIRENLKEYCYEK